MMPRLTTGVLAASLLTVAAVAQPSGIGAKDPARVFTEDALAACLAFRQAPADAAPTPPVGFVTQPNGWALAQAGGTVVGIAGGIQTGEDGAPSGVCRVAIEGPTPWFPDWMATQSARFESEGWWLEPVMPPPGEVRITFSSSSEPASLTIAHRMELPGQAQVLLVWNK